MHLVGVQRALGCFAAEDGEDTVPGISLRFRPQQRSRIPHATDKALSSQMNKQVIFFFFLKMVRWRLKEIK